MTYQVLLVDDEPLARERLKRLLTEHSNFRWVAEASDGESALEWLKQNPVDLVLLDIQMPGMNGLQMADAMRSLERAPLVIFCTAYDEHALQAFRVKAIDYLLKPIAKDELSTALSRAADWLDQHGDVEQISSGRTHLSARTHQGMQLIPLVQVRCFMADQKYVNVLHQEGQTLIDDSLKQLEEEFADDFIRVHRNALVARHAIDRLEAQEEGGHRVYLKGMDDGISVSRRHLPGVRRAMKRI